MQPERSAPSVIASATVSVQGVWLLAAGAAARGLESTRSNRSSARCAGLETADYRFHIGTRKTHGQRLTYLLGGPLQHWAEHEDSGAAR